MPINRCLSLLFLPAICASCASLTIPIHPERVYVITDSIQKFNMLYEGVSIDSGTGGHHPLLWDLLTSRFGSSRKYTNQSVKITFLSPTTARADLIVNGEIVRTGKFRGKPEDGCFYLRRKFRILPFFPLASGYINQKQRICLLDDHLVMDAAWNEKALALIWIVKSKGQDSFRFPKKEAVRDSD